MERRDFLETSALGTGMLLSGLASAGPHTTVVEEPATPERNPSSSRKLVEVPGTSYETNDTLTKVPVTITISNFLIAPTELTPREFEQVMSHNPSFHKGSDLPVESVNW